MVSQSATNITLDLTPLYPTEDAVSKSSKSNLKSELLQNHLDSKLKIFHQNIRGLSFKTEEFLLSVSKINPQVICITEHYLKLDEIDIMDFGQYTLRTQYCRMLFKHGGVLILTLNNIVSDVIELNTYCREKDLEICGLKLQLPTHSQLILCVYRSPTGDLSCFLMQLEKLLIKLYKPLVPIILCGDSNINFADSSSGFRT